MTSIEQIAQSPAPLRHYLAEECAGFWVGRHFLDALAGHLGYEDAEQERAATVLNRLREIARLAQAT